MQESLLTILRDQTTTREQFRKAAHQLASLLAAKASMLLSDQQRVILVPILRSGVALLPAFQNCFPDAPIGFFGIKRDEKTAKPLPYYENIPSLQPTDLVLLLDPMIATGGSALFALQKLKEKGASQMALIGVLAAQEGLQRIVTQYPDLTVIVAAVDPELDAHKFIVPGLGDFGDRYFGT